MLNADFSHVEGHYVLNIWDLWESCSVHADTFDSLLHRYLRYVIDEYIRVLHGVLKIIQNTLWNNAYSYTFFTLKCNVILHWGISTYHHMAYEGITWV